MNRATEASHTTAAPTFSAADEADQLKDYRSLSGLAVVGLILGLASPVSMVRPALVTVPLAAVLVCSIALLRIRSSEGRLTGGWTALVGLCVGVMFVACVPALALTRNAILQHQARPMAEEWFRLLGEDAPHKALQLTRPYQERLPHNANLWELYRKDTAAGNRLREFVDNPLVHTLLALGTNAQAQYYQAGAVQMEGVLSQVEQIYAVTFEDDASGKKKTFFARVVLQRTVRRNGLVTWRVLDFTGDFLPPALENRV